MFAGRTPYVWLSNQYGNTGVDVTSAQTTNNSANQIRFVADPLNQPRTVQALQIASELGLPDADVFPISARTRASVIR